MTPSIGRIVHYKREDGSISPAIITAVNTADIVLTVFGKTETLTGMISYNQAAGPDSAEPRNWWWPERIAG
jgi:hypothetical protein